MVRPALFWTAVVMGILACAPRQTLETDETSGETVQESQQVAETLTVVDTVAVETVAITEEPVITFEETPAQPPVETTTVAPPPSSPPPPAEEPAPPRPQVRRLPGYRVQVFASMYRDKAEAFREGIEARWGVKAYVVEEYDPVRGVTLYKVRVGNFRDRPAAEAMRDRVRAVWGYTDAFVVEDEIEVQE